MPYIHGVDQKQFRSFIYGFTWEDPYDDMKRFKIGRKDTVLCITSAGDNALHYAIEGKPKRIHCVDSRFPLCCIIGGKILKVYC
jgi:betaine lipid synthase